MKNRKFLGVFSFLLSVCLLFATLPFVSANADGEGTTEPPTEKTVVTVYEAESCKIERLELGDFTVKTDENDSSYIAEGITVKKGETEVKVYVDGTINTEAADKCWVTISGSDTEKKVTYIKFDTLTEGEKGESGDGFAEYTVTVTVKEGDNNVEKSATVKVYAEQPYGKEVLKEKTDVEEMSVTTDTSTKKVTFKKEELWKLIDEDYVIGDTDALSAKIYIQTPGVTWSSSATTTLSGTDSEKTYSISSRGDYRFYVLFTDKKGNTTEKDSELVEKPDGFYKVDSETDEETKVISIFSFAYTPDETVKVTCSNTDKVKKGYEGQVQKSVTYTLANAENKDVKFVLMFKADGETAYAEAVNGTDADFDASEFTNSSLVFTPLKKGEYSFKVYAVENEAEKVVLEAGANDNVVIKVTDSVTIVKRENTAFTDFVKNNWKSLIFLGIAVLCLIAIIVIACWKPKDKTAVKRQVEDSADKEDKNVAKTSETKNAEDEAIETVDTEEGAKEENAAVEETAEVTPEAKVTEEAKVEESSETLVENAEEVANETPAENAEANAETSVESSETPVEIDNGDKAE